MAKKEYSDLLKDPRWQKKRLEVMKRDNFTCQICGDNLSTLNVHHKHYKNGLRPWEYKNDDYITLCECCHQFVEKNKNIYGLNVCDDIQGKSLKSKNPEFKLKLYKYIDLSQVYVFNKDNEIVKVANILTT
jgi:Restriction endonuclease